MEDFTREVLAVVDDLIARWNAKDAAAFAALFVADADFTDVIGKTAHGRAAIEEQHRFPFTRNMREAVLTTDVVSVRMLGRDASVALVSWTTTKNLSLDGEPVPDRKGTMQIVLHKSGGSWRIESVLNQDPMGVYA